MFSTKNPEINSILKELLSRMQEEFGAKLIGLYLYGSLVWGDFDFDISDIDLLAVLTSDITEKEVISLNKLHETFVSDYKEWSDRIEVQYVSTNALKTFKSSVNIMAVISPGEPLHRVDYVEEYLMNFYFVQEQGEALYGPDPKMFIQSISKQDFLDTIIIDARKWRTHIENAKYSRPYQGFAIMTLCRAFYTFTYGQQVSKRKAAEWVKTNYPQWTDLIDSAFIWRKLYREKVENPEDTYPEAKKFVDFMIEKIIS